MKKALALAVLVIAALAVASRAIPTPDASQHVVLIYMPRGTSDNCARVLPLKRLVPAPALVSGAMRALLGGPTRAERRRGYGGWFSAATAGHLRSVRIAHGVAHIDFRNFAAHVPSASTSCGSALLLAQLNRTATQFPTVRHAIYSFDGSRRVFYEWLQRQAPVG